MDLAIHNRARVDGKPEFTKPAVPNGAELLVECLYRHGVRHVFGMPGSHSTYIYDAIHRHGGIQTILCRHEQAGSFMADGYARSTGRPGVVCTTAGPGATNALTGIAEAYSDSVPVLLIAGQVNHDRIHQECGRYHEIDLEGIFRPCVRFAATTMRNEQIPSMVDRAFEAMVAGRPGPAALMLPQDLMAMPALDAPRASPVELRRFISSNDPCDDSYYDLIRQAIERIGTSQRPVIVAGGGCVSSGAAGQVEELAQRLGCPVVTTLNGKGILDERSAFSFGHGRTRRARMVLLRADLVIAIGCRFTEVFTASGTIPLPKRLIQIDIDPSQIGTNYPVELGIVGDARTVVQAIVSGLTYRDTSWREIWQRARNAEQLKPEWLIDTLRAELPETSVIFTDASEMGLRMQTDFAAYAPRTFFYPSNYATLGWGFPAAVGAATGQSDRWTVCMSGDGGFLMTAQELATATRYNLRMIIVVHNDSAYGAIKALQRSKHESRYVDIDLNNPDLVKFGQSFGVPSCRARSSEEFASAVQKALGNDGPSLIEVPDEWRSVRL
jgi:thiamine pyrophosphate-dependent acetolactate synthase large subunit-like protein